MKFGENDYGDISFCLNKEEGCECSQVKWTITYGECTNTLAAAGPQELDNPVGEDCYSYYRQEDLDCVNSLTGRDCGNPQGTCDFLARAKVTGTQVGPVEYEQSDGTWGSNPTTCECTDFFVSLVATANCGG